MLLRAWQTGVDESRAAEYETFARERSLPMFHRHEGLLGVLLLAPAPGRRMVLTAWRDAAAVQALEASEDYRATVDAITRAGFLRAPQSVNVFELDP